MARLPVLSGRDVNKALQKAGFEIHHQTGDDRRVSSSDLGPAERPRRWSACYHPRMVGVTDLSTLCRRYDLDALYAFGSRATEVAASGRQPLQDT